MGASLPVLANGLLDRADSSDSSRLQAGWEARLRKALSDTSQDATQSFAVAQAELCNLAPQQLSSEGIEALLLIAHRHYNAARAQAGVAPAAHALAGARALGDLGLIRRAATFHGVMNGETGNLPSAVENYAEALDVASALGDTTAQAAVWNNLGLSLQYAGQYADATR